MTIQSKPTARRPSQPAEATLFVGQSTTGPGVRPPVAAEFCDDFVVNMLEIVRGLVPEMTDEQQRAADLAIREFGGGDRPYIARRHGEGRSERNTAIRRDHQRGESVALLCRRYNLSRMQVYRVIGIGGE